MRVAYFDCISGISGDMVLGALVDAGLPLSRLKRELKKLALDGYTIGARTVTKSGVRATKVDVTAGGGETRRATEIASLIDQSELGTPVKEAARGAFACLAEAEAVVHGTTPADVHFDEVGAIDSIIDIVGACAGLSALGIERLHCSPLRLSRPAPATLEILKGLAVETHDLGIESVTPTGAALMRTLAEAFGPMPPMKLDEIGYGAGSADLEAPNVLRVMIGEEAKGGGRREAGGDPEEVVLLETNVDDVTGETLGYLMETLLEAGALDVWFTPIYMKKNRPAFTLLVLSPTGHADQMKTIIFRETGALGLRTQMIERDTLDRAQVTVKTDLGEVRVKVGRWRGEIVSISPEYEDCARLARKSGRSLEEVYHHALKSYQSSKPSH